MRVLVAGAHGGIGRRLVRLLSAEGDEVVGLVRNPDHVADVEADGGRPVVLDLERTGVDEVASALAGADAAVFTAGTGAGSGDARKESMDRDGAALLADAAERAGVRRYLLVSAMGVEAARGGADSPGLPTGMGPYLEAKLASEDDLRGRGDLAWTVVRPGHLLDDPGTGRVRLAPGVDLGSIARDDVAAVLAALLRTEPDRTAGRVLELVAGGTPVPDAVAALQP